MLMRANLTLVSMRTMMLISQRTSYEYWGSSLLTPAQIMEQETYYRYAEVAVQHVTYILQLILLHQAWCVTLHATIGQWSGIVSIASAIASAWGKVQQIMNAVNQMFFIARWIRAHGEITLSYAKDLTVLFKEGTGLDCIALEESMMCLTKIATLGLANIHKTYVVSMYI